MALGKDCGCSRATLQGSYHPGSADGGTVRVAQSCLAATPTAYGSGLRCARWLLMRRSTGTVDGVEQDVTGCAQRPWCRRPSPSLSINVPYHRRAVNRPEPASAGSKSLSRSAETAIGAAQARGRRAHWAAFSPMAHGFKRGPGFAVTPILGPFFECSADHLCQAPRPLRRVADILAGIEEAAYPFLGQVVLQFRVGGQ